MENKYCVGYGKYSLEIRSCKDGLSWEQAMDAFIYLAKTGDVKNG